MDNFVGYANDHMQSKSTLWLVQKASCLITSKAV